MASTLTLLVGLALLGVTGWRLSLALGLRTPTSLLMGVYAFASAELVVLALLLSAFRRFTPFAVLIALAAACVVTVVATRRARSGIDWRETRRAIAADPAVVVLLAVVALVFAYEVALALGTPQVEDDVLTFHLVRAGLWRQHHGITYLRGIFDLRNNAYPPGGEIPSLTALTLAGDERFAALGELSSFLALIVGTIGISRRVGFSRREAAFGGLLVGTLPIVVLQAGTAMSDLVVASFLLTAAFFVVDRSRASPALAGLGTALAMDVKLTAPLGVPLLLALGWFAGPRAWRRTRLVAVVAGAVIGAYWYVVNLVETHTWDGHVSDEFHVDRSVPAIVARVLRLAIEFIDVSGANGPDRWLYAVAAAITGVVLAAGFLSRRRTGRAVRDAIVAGLLVLAPLVLVRLSHGFVRAYFKLWTTVGRRDLADIDPGHDITRAASNFSWFGPLGSLALVAATAVVVALVVRRRGDRVALILVLAPVYWLVAFSVAFFYQEWAGRFFVFPFALAAATWGVLLRWRPAAWATVAIAATTALLVTANDARRPSGLRLLGGPHLRSIWRTPGWQGGPETRRDYDAPIRLLSDRIPSKAAVGLDITPSDPVYPFFGSTLGHRIVFVDGGDRDASGASWVFVRPQHPVALCHAAWRRVATTGEGWQIFRRVGPSC